MLPDLVTLQSGILYVLRILIPLLSIVVLARVSTPSRRGAGARTR